MKLIGYTLFFVFINFSHPVVIQDGWHILADIKIEKKFDELLNQEVDSPVYGKKPIAFEGQEIKLSGYMIPIDDLLSQQSFVLSSLPFQSCFFCGGAGPETVIEVNTTTPYKYTDNRITVSGTLKLNRTDPFDLYYTLVNAEVSK